MFLDIVSRSVCPDLYVTVRTFLLKVPGFRPMECPNARKVQCGKNFAHALPTGKANSWTAAEVIVIDG